MKFQGHNRIQRVHSFAGLLGTPLRAEYSAACWRRELKGDFEEVARALEGADDVKAVSDGELRMLGVSPAGQLAVALILEDLGRLRAAGQDPEVSCVRRYPRDPDEVLPTDVYSFHVDSATAETETFLCSYTPPASEGLHPWDARRAVDVPDVRQRLLAQFGGRDDGRFEAHLDELYYNLHFLARPGARPFSFGVGHLWRLSVQTPGFEGQALIHRAPVEIPGAGPRLLLIS